MTSNQGIKRSRLESPGGVAFCCCLGIEPDRIISQIFFLDGGSGSGLMFRNAAVTNFYYTFQK